MGQPSPETAAHTRLFPRFCAVGILAKASYAMARTPVLALFAAALGAAPEAIGFAVAISTVTGIFFKLPAGVLADTIGRKKVFLLSLCVFAFVPLAYPLVTNYRALVVVRFFHGFATACYGPVAMTIIADVAGARRGEMLSWFSSITIVGSLIGAPLGGAVLSYLAGAGRPEIGHFHIVYYVVAGLGLSSLLIGLWTARDWPEAARTITGNTVAHLWRQFHVGVREILLNKTVFLTSNMEGVQNLSLGALEAFLPVYVVYHCGLSEWHAGVLWGIQIVTTIFSKPIMGKISDRHGRQPLIFWGMFLCAVPFAIMPWTQSFWILLVLAMVFGLGEAVVTSSAAAMIADLCKAERLGSAMGAFGTLFDVGHAAGPLLAGFLITAFGGSDYRAPFAILAGILVISALIFRLQVMRVSRAAN